MPRRWIVISLDGLAGLALSPYGSSWNDTPELDRLAASGLTWDRVIVPSEETSETLHRCWTHRIGDQDWLQACRRFGRVELIAEQSATVTTAWNELADDVGFDACTLVEPELEPIAAEEIESTGLGQLFSALIDRLSPDDDGSKAAAPDWAVLWLHSDLLTRHWDAPRWLFPVDRADDFEEPEDPSDPATWESADGGGDANTPPVAVTAPPPLWDSTTPPSLRITAADHPDTVTSWMQTYGCQVRLVDRLLSWVAEVIGRSDPDIGLAVVGTSGMALGQDGWIGHRAGPLRSPEIQVPTILHVPGSAPLRWPYLVSLVDVMPHLVPGNRLATAASWGGTSRSGETEITTASFRAKRAVTTDRWFYVRDLDDSSRLYLKPDDRDDVNDVANRCLDVVEGFSGSANQS